MIHAYRIGVHMAMHDGVSAALGVIAGHMLGLQRHINSAQVGFNRLGLAIAGAGAAFAGVGLLRGMGALIRHGEELITQQGILRTAGLSQQEVAHSTARAWEITRQVAGTTVTENLKAIGELRTVFGDLHEAEQFAPHFQRLAMTLGTVTGRDPGNAAYQAARFMELTGGLFRPGTKEINPESMQRNMDRLTQVVIATHGRVGPDQLLNFAQQAGQFARGMSPDALYGTLPTVIQAMGGHRAGTAVAAMGAMVSSGILPQRIVKDLRRFDLIDMSKVERTRTGVRVGPGGIRNAQQFMRDPFAWFTETFMPALERKGVKGQQEFLEWIGRLFGRQTAQRLGAEFYQGLQQIQRDKHLIAQALVGEDAYKILEQTPRIGFKALGASLENLWIALGEPAARAAGPIALTLARSIDRLTAVIVAHPEAAKFLTVFAVGLGAALVVIGALAIASAAIAAIGGGGVAAFILAVGAALSGLAYVAVQINWQRVMSDLQSSFGQAIAYFSALPGRIWQAATGAWNSVLATLDGWRVGILQRIEEFRSAVAVLEKAVIDWLISLPGRLLQAIPGMTNPMDRGGPMPPTDNPMGDQGGLGGANPSRFVPPAGGAAGGTQEAAVYLDGQRVGTAIVPVLGRMMNGPAQAGSRADPRRGLGDLVSA